jgi:hypothetical protein
VVIDILKINGISKRANEKKPVKKRLYEELFFLQASF